MIKRDYYFEELQAAWPRLPLSLKIRIVAIVAWSVWRRWTWEAWLRWVGVCWLDCVD